MRTVALTLLLALAGATPAAARPVYLTFDDGPGRYTSEVLRVLREHHARATFFMCGSQVRRNAEIAQRVARRHRIGNHTWSHPDLAELSYDEQLRELRRTQRIIERVTGVTPTLARPPHGTGNESTSDAMRELGLSFVGWDAWGDDWDEKTRARHIVNQILRQVDEGASVILLHDSDAGHPEQDFTATVKALPRIIDGLRERGHELRRWPEQTTFEFPE